MNEVFVAQKRVIRAMAGKRYWRSNSALDSCRPLFKKGLVFQPVCTRMPQIPQKHPEKSTKLTDISQTHRHITRNTIKNMCENDLFVSECSLKISAASPAVMIPRLFNALPDLSSD